ncbi:MAG: antibiotic biosynthesis monooxygenase, partial [Armatimonadetes bacterium]|nr:antibiotic biosynthesis monooxygenase [Armatimonadota bacterium]
VVCVTVFVKSDKTTDFILAALENARNTRQEQGNVRFDVLQGEDDPCRFFLYEVYRSPEDFASHQKTSHYLAWREQVADWMAEPRKGLKYTNLFPDPWD